MVSKLKRFGVLVLPFLSINNCYKVGRLRKKRLGILFQKLSVLFQNLVYCCMGDIFGSESLENKKSVIETNQLRILYYLS